MNPKLTVVMPTFKRPEMLALALRNLTIAIAKTRTANATADFDVRIFLDHSKQERLAEVEYVRDTYYPDALIFHAQNHILQPGGCWNILESLKQGYLSGADYTLLVEEDVLVAPDFFDWHLKAQQSGCFASCGRLIDRYGRDYYTNPGSCFSRQSLVLLVPHIGMSYFAGRKAYLEENFPVWEEASDLDDGLIRRVIKKHGGTIAFPETPKCAHIGWKWYNSCDRFLNPGTIQERITGLEKMLAEVPDLDPTGRYCQDLERLQ